MDTTVARPVRGKAKGPPDALFGGDDPLDDGDARAAAAVEAFVAEVAADASGSATPPGPSEVMARWREALTGAMDRPTAAARPPVASDLAQQHDSAADGAAAADPRSSPRTAAAQRAPEPVSTLRGLADPASWDRAVRDESARVARFGRPVTVVMAELADLDDVADRLGRDVADLVVVETARLLASKGRAADPVAWLGGATFGILLLETEETRASGYIDRVRAAADHWLDSAGLSVRLSLGWASPADAGDVVAAATLARQRMQAVARPSQPVTRTRPS